MGKPLWKEMLSPLSTHAVHTFRKDRESQVLLAKHLKQAPVSDFYRNIVWLAGKRACQRTKEGVCTPELTKTAPLPRSLQGFCCVCTVPGYNGVQGNNWCSSAMLQLKKKTEEYISLPCYRVCHDVLSSLLHSSLQESGKTQRLNSVHSHSPVKDALTLTGCSCFSFPAAPCVGVKRLLRTCTPPAYASAPSWAGGTPGASLLQGLLHLAC